MQRISSFREGDRVVILAAAKQLEIPARGLQVDLLFMEGRWYVRFTWPDWPRQQADAIGQEVNQFHSSHPELHAIQQGSPDWVSISHGWEADYESAEAIGERFKRSFGGTATWVESEKDRRGQITAECSVEELGGFLFNLSWRSSSVQPLGSLKAGHYDAFRQASYEVMEWAGSRIRPLLDTLRAKLVEVYSERFRGLYVFGSYAQPDVGIKLPIDSDLDVALLLTDFEDPHAERERVSEIVAELSLNNDIVISLIPIREADYTEGRTNFTRVISEYAVPVK